MPSFGVSEMVDGVHPARLDDVVGGASVGGGCVDQASASAASTASAASAPAATAMDPVVWNDLKSRRQTNLEMDALKDAK